MGRRVHRTYGSASLVDNKVLKETPDGEAERKGDVKWSAIQDKYFLSVLMPQKASAALAKKEGDKLVSAGVRFAAPANGSMMAMQLYAGPKEYDTLKLLNVGIGGYDRLRLVRVRKLGFGQGCG